MSTPSQAIPRIFVSHSHQDDDYCRAFVRELRAARVDVWYDEHNLTSGQLLTDIQRELHARPIFVPILSKAALHESTWVKNECMWAFSLLQRDPARIFLPVTGTPIAYSDFGADWLFLEGFKRIEAPKMLPYPPEEAARRVLTAIGHSTLPVEVAAPVPTATASAPAPAPARTIPASSAPATPPARPAAPRSSAPSIPPERFPRRLAGLGFTTHSEDGVAYILPPLCPVPAGPFLMGSDPTHDKPARDNEQPQHTVTLSAYQIARYPVTVAEYACFVRAGHNEPYTWRSDVDWYTQLQRLDHPVTCVSWHDALAYAAWLAQQTGQPWRLPSEAEWEKAARGADGRIYPWGNTFDASRCNTDKSDKRATTPAGSYPTGASPYGAQDMAGNVWEWTATIFKPYIYRENGGTEELKSTENRVLRGGSWGDFSSLARAAYRSYELPDYLVEFIGFRVALAAPGSAP